MISRRPTCICLTSHTQMDVKTDPRLQSEEAHRTLSHTVWPDEISAGSLIFCQVHPDHSDSALTHGRQTVRSAKPHGVRPPSSGCSGYCRQGWRRLPARRQGQIHGVRPLRTRWTSRPQVTGGFIPRVSTGAASAHIPSTVQEGSLFPHPLQHLLCVGVF